MIAVIRLAKMSKGRPTITFRLDPESYQWVSQYAKDTGKQKTEIIKAALTTYRMELIKEQANLAL